MRSNSKIKQEMNWFAQQVAQQVGFSDDDQDAGLNIPDMPIDFQDFQDELQEAVQSRDVHMNLNSGM